MRVFVINPGSTSTKLALFTVDASGAHPLERAELSHPQGQSAREDLAAREPLVRDLAAQWRPFDAIAARGGLVGPVRPGVYAVDDALTQVCLEAPHGYHPANLGAPLAQRLAAQYRVPAYVVDPPTVDEMAAVSRITGVPGIERRSRVHALNLRYVARRVAAARGLDWNEAVLAGAHLGGGSSAALFVRGRMIDATDALLGEGPFSANRAGTLPIHGVLRVVEKRGLEGARDVLARGSGFKGLVGTEDLREVEARLEDPKVRLVVEAYALSIAKTLAALAAHARPHAFFLTGGAARFSYAVERVRAHLNWMAPVEIVPGEFEMEALAHGAWRGYNGIEPVRHYGDEDGKARV
ncbi:butyrate kinase [Marinithermus hydrothermalis]|uniref:butyrate kinase n=1 Tax=Marinithermus hydrothermalis TaxID=186192 RepID=UPI001FDF5A34|nr:butyrate kinase [Marinithermus hydrothermalis]